MTWQVSWKTTIWCINVQARRYLLKPNGTIWIYIKNAIPDKKNYLIAVRLMEETFGQRCPAHIHKTPHKICPKVKLKETLKESGSHNVKSWVGHAKRNTRAWPRSHGVLSDAMGLYFERPHRQPHNENTHGRGMRPRKINWNSVKEKYKDGPRGCTSASGPARSPHDSS